MAFGSEIDYTKIVSRNRTNLNKLYDSPSNINNTTDSNDLVCNFKYDDTFNKFISQIEMKLLRAIELHDTVNDENASAETKKEMQRNNIDELLSSANFLQTLLNFLILFLTRSLQPLNLEIMRLIPSVSFSPYLIVQKESNLKIPFFHSSAKLTK